MKIAITGASGFIGSALTKALAEENHDLRLLMHRNKPATVKSDLSDSPGRTELVHGDVQDTESLKTAFKGVDVVFHLVGIIAETRNLTFEKTVTVGTQNVVEAAAACSVKKLIYLSALGTSDKAISKYHQSKWKAEEEVRNSGIEFVILRPSVIFGPGDDFLNKISSMIKKLPFAPIIGNGEYLLQPVYIYDLIKILVACLKNSKASGKTIEVGGPRAYRYKEIIRILKSHLNKNRINIYLPVWLMSIAAAVMEKLMKPAPITTDQLKMMQAGNYCDNKEMKEIFEINLTDLEDGLKEYMR